MSDKQWLENSQTAVKFPKLLPFQEPASGQAEIPIIVARQKETKDWPRPQFSRRKFL